MGEEPGFGRIGRPLDEPDGLEVGLGGHGNASHHRRLSDGGQEASAVLGEDGLRWPASIYGDRQVLQEENCDGSVHDDMAWESFAKLWLL